MSRLKTVNPVLGFLLALLVVLPAAAAAAPEPIVEVENRGYALIFYPTVEFKEMILTVTGPCDFQYRQVIDEGELKFVLDERTIDGTYTWNVMRNEKISGEILEILQQARKNFDEETPRALCRAGKLPEPPLSHSAGFRVVRGKIVYDPGAVEKQARREDGGAGTPGIDLGGKLSDPFAKDFVINDDLIVDGSACIGFDCVNGESFGFDTIRLKENNLRIKFDDTSVAASYPRTDWQLTANASANGGASKFSIDDISGNRTPFTVEANARSHSLYVDDGGRIGSRTSTPSVEIHTIDGDTPTLRLQQDGSSGFAPQTWDVAGNETNFFIRDVTNGSQLPFRIRPDAPTSSIFIDVDGEVGAGTSSPGAKLHILETGTAVSAFAGTALVVQNSATSADGAIVTLVSNAAQSAQVTFGDTADQLAGRILYDNATDKFDFWTGGAVRMSLDANGLVTTTGGSCDPGPCDGTFIDYELESIDEHAAYMWENKHLWGVGPTPEDGPINLPKKTTGMLHELEKAHIYIEQLHGNIQDLQAEVGALKALVHEVLEAPAE